MTLYVVLLSLAPVFLHILIRILVPDLPKVNNEPVNSDHLPSGSRPLTLCVFAVSDTWVCVRHGKNTPANEKLEEKKKHKKKPSPYNNNIIMYIYHTLINALSAHMIHINLNMIFYTHAEHSPTKTICIKYYLKTKTKTALQTHTHTT